MNQPPGKLPPLHALRAFEAAARHQSVKHAAIELCVTPGAVSQMIKVLELHLAVPLFDRVNRGITLTEAGRNYLPPVRNALRQIAEASARVAGQAETGPLTVSVTPFFASTWLIGRLKAFREAHPHIDLQVAASTALVNWSRDPVDIAVRHGSGRYPGLRSERLVTVEVIPVASPDLVAQRGLPAHPAELAHWPQVHDAERSGWPLWLQSQGVDDVGPPRGPAFDDAGLLLQAVLVGHGAGLLPAALVAPQLADGQLVQLGSGALLEEFAYYLVYPEGRQKQPRVAAFRAWILEAAHRVAPRPDAAALTPPSPVPAIASPA